VGKRCFQDPSLLQVATSHLSMSTGSATFPAQSNKSECASRLQFTFAITNVSLSCPTRTCRCSCPRPRYRQSPHLCGRAIYLSLGLVTIDRVKAYSHTKYDDMSRFVWQRWMMVVVAQKLCRRLQLSPHFHLAEAGASCDFSR
jgi:hypothetical protein